MTDRAFILELCRRLGLDRAPEGQDEPGPFEYVETPESIVLGGGREQRGFMAFDFFADGELEGFGVQD